MVGAERRGRSQLITGEREIAEIESRSNGAADQGIRPGGAGCLPVLTGLATVGRRHPEIEYRGLIEVPGLVRLHPMPGLTAAARQQKVDGRECCALPPRR